MQSHLLDLNSMLKLQEDIASMYLIGRPRIENISSIHIPYAFRVSKPTSEAHPLNFAQDLNQVGKLLPTTLKVRALNLYKYSCIVSVANW